MSFWQEHPEWARRRAKGEPRPPTCKAHGIVKVRATPKSRYECPECDREEWERGDA